MKRHVSATVKSYSAVKTKKDLKEKAAAINAGQEGVDVDVTINDPFGLGNGTAGIKDLLSAALPEGTILQVSNEKRSWFASVAAVNGKLKVS